MGQICSTKTQELSKQNGIQEDFRRISYYFKVPPDIKF